MLSVEAASSKPKLSPKEISPMDIAMMSYTPAGDGSVHVETSVYEFYERLKNDVLTGEFMVGQPLM